MTDIERQILINQLAIMNTVASINSATKIYMFDAYEQTQKLLDEDGRDYQFKYKLNRKGY